ncbi:protein FAM83A isoform X2 [Genypterus blacodes]|uniref:protein FAM83A isoform X2 n=1 Tax=Genypterus blacodes TaxID=154954 RepID=UPI003F7681F1
MPKSQEQSLDEDAVFLPLTESCPEFLHSERERKAVERLLSAGPEAFYSSIGAERSGCFLSPEEVSQISSWAQDYHVSQVQVQREEGDEEDGDSQMGDYSSTYFPAHSDTPAPCLDLGWPERFSWQGRGSVTVHTNPPAEEQPHIREIIRRHLQKASKVIAIVTDKLTDGAVIKDLHNAASRGVPVYIILNQRSTQEKFMLNWLRHPNMQVRVLGGKTFCTRKGRMVVGEMKDKFLLVDLETVIHGSYSLTWTDAHLHRQLITVLKGPAVESFDKEFRILFAASLPIPETQRGDGLHLDSNHRIKDFSHLNFLNQLSMEPESIGPPSPPADCPLDWEAMGVIQRDGFFPGSPVNHYQEIMAIEKPLENNIQFQTNTPVMEKVSYNRNRFPEQGGYTIHEDTPEINSMRDRSPSFSNTHSYKTINLPSPELTTDRQKRIEQKIGLSISRQNSKERIPNLDDRTTTRPEEESQEQTHNMGFSFNHRRERSKRDSILEENEESSVNESFKAENTPSSRKPLILKVPQTDSFGSLSDIMRRLQAQPSVAAEHRKGSKSELTRSMMDLSPHMSREERGSTLPRLQTSNFDTSTATPLLALMKKRNEDAKSLLFRTQISFQPNNRPRSYSFMDWRKPRKDREEGLE